MKGTRRACNRKKERGGGQQSNRPGGKWIAGREKGEAAANTVGVGGGEQQGERMRGEGQKPNSRRER